MKSRNSVQRLTLCALLLSLMLVLAWVEHLLPNLGYSGVKLGLSNGVLVFALYMLGVPTAWGLMVMKVLLSALFMGAISTIPYALAGGALSMLGMTLLSRASWAHPVTVSILGGALHNIGQVLMVMLIIQTTNVGLLGYMAFLIVVGMLCGLLTGVCSVLVMKHLKHLKR